MLAVMTSEYVEKAPMHERESAPPEKSVDVILSAESARVLEGEQLAAKLRDIGYDTIAAGKLGLFIGESRAIAAEALQWSAKAKGEFGLIWIDSQADLEVLRPALEAVKQHLSPENIVFVGLREASAEEAAYLKESRATVFTMVEIDATGIREVMREAIRIASAGTKGIHVSYSPTVSEIPGSAEGSGGITVRETHQAMEAVASSGKLCCMDVSPLSATTGNRVAGAVAHFVLSAFGKRIL
jgi:arginase family enzyme